MPEDFAAQHRLVLDEAQKIYENRSKVRGQMWLETTISRELDMIREKLDRAENAHNMGLGDPDFAKEFDDSLLDLINFAVFALRKQRRGVEV